MKKFAALICSVVLALGIGAGCFAEDAETVDIRILATSDLTLEAAASETWR